MFPFQLLFHLILLILASSWFRAFGPSLSSPLTVVFLGVGEQVGKLHLQVQGYCPSPTVKLSEALKDSLGAINTLF